MSNESKKNKNEKKLTKKQQLSKEIVLLRAENAYLNKLRASGVNIPIRQLKQNPGSSTNIAAYFKVCPEKETDWIIHKWKISSD
ncbi:hypothetical protein [Bacillus sp. PS06]|uniref:hypothetical protein n=1 Tax=Bacillus sp. PS06 TaxID=2764176 RepID=UPI00177FBFCC|nr:hypothetical protein [Bacillus sp. PS06]MBD8069415.1 hypothetical protein [Bacillus sp. PS06]